MLLRRDVLTGLSVFSPLCFDTKLLMRLLDQSSPADTSQNSGQHRKMKLEKRGPVTVTHLHVVDVVAIPLLWVLCFWHILKPLYSLHLFCLLLHPFAFFRTVRKYTMLTQTIQIHMEHAAQHVFGLQSKASVRSRRAWHLAQRMLFELTGLSTCHPMWIHVA